jgi:hypothetical protein
VVIRVLDVVGRYVTSEEPNRSLELLRWPRLVIDNWELDISPYVRTRIDPRYDVAVSVK